MERPQTAREIAQLRDEVRRVIRARVRRDLGDAGYDDVEDLVQDVLVAALDAERRGLAGAYDPRRGAWTTYVVMLAFERLRSAARARRSAGRTAVLDPATLAALRPAFEPTPDARLVAQERTAELLAALVRALGRPLSGLPDVGQLPGGPHAN